MDAGEKMAMCFVAINVKLWPTVNLKWDNKYLMNLHGPWQDDFSDDIVTMSIGLTTYDKVR